VATDEAKTRANEWFVPHFGPEKFRLFVGMTYLPYTAMNVSYVVIGSLLSPRPVNWNALGAMAFVYAVAVGVSAHALDAAAPNKPWGAFLSRRQLFALAMGSLAISLSVGVFFAAFYAPLLFVVGSLEVFFLFAYNLELFGGRFHTRNWFSLSWGFLPVVAGYVAQTNAVGLTAAAGGLVGFVTANAEINVSKPYKALKGSSSPDGAARAHRLEQELKALVAGVLSLAALLFFVRTAT